MIRFSTRRWLPAVLLLAGAAAPVYASLLAEPGDTCADPGALRDPTRIPQTGALVERHDRYAGGEYLQWTEGQVQAPGLRPLGLRILRTPQVRRLYYSPRPLLGTFGFLHGREELEWLQVDGVKLPVRFHRSLGERSRHQFAYLLLYEGRPVPSVLGASLRAAPRRIGSGPDTASLYVVEGSAPHERGEALDRAMERWLAAAWRDYQRVCTP